MNKLLIIDDDEELCGELAQILRSEDFEVDMVFDGLTGQRKIDQGGYQLIILDLKLPGINGYSVLKNMKARSQPVKVMVLSGRPMGDTLPRQAHTDQQEEETILGLADAVMNKPFVIEHFIRTIKELCG